MSITVNCSCSKKIKVPDSAAGKKVRCAGCGAIHRVPALVGAEASISDGQPKCARCGGAVDPRADLYEFFAYRKARTRFQLGGSMHLFQETVTFDGLVQMNGNACQKCVREIQGKHKLVWLAGLAAICVIAVVTTIAVPRDAKVGWSEPGFLIIVGGVFAAMFVLGVLGIVFPFFRFCIGQRIVIAPQRRILAALGLNKVRGGRFGSTAEQQIFAPMIFK